ncbi:hypothetical protein OG994_25925 [Micromonospora globbae]|uniref:Uncharacterized protein n=1 Tax=Micromonospora globbae TaxID=1894969 RepID=A0ABZ1S3F5_9ACTN|nr:hypothetical protein [Micromonospora globbae]
MQGERGGGGDGEQCERGAVLDAVEQGKAEGVAAADVGHGDEGGPAGGGVVPAEDFEVVAGEGEETLVGAVGGVEGIRGVVHHVYLLAQSGRRARTETASRAAAVLRRGL